MGTGSRTIADVVSCCDDDHDDELCVRKDHRVLTGDRRLHVTNTDVVMTFNQTYVPRDG